MRELSVIEQELVAGGWASDSDGDFVDITNDAYSSGGALWQTFVRSDTTDIQPTDNDKIQYILDRANNVYSVLENCLDGGLGGNTSGQPTAMSWGYTFNNFIHNLGYDIVDTGAYQRNYFGIIPDEILTLGSMAVEANARLGMQSFYDENVNYVDQRNPTNEEALAIARYTQLDFSQAKNLNIVFSNSIRFDVPAQTFGNNIYFNTNFFAASESLVGNIEAMGTLIHEAQHSSQYLVHSAAHLAANALNAQLDNFAGYYYGNSIQSGVSFANLTTEQQSSLMEDIYRMEHGDSARSYIQSASGQSKPQPDLDYLKYIASEVIYP
jgi:hypothetical protein